ncbi:MAG: Asp23/Gls24 family envelope stress response protein [Lachnospiraceae bacterium]|nr:Asp23/Gls24 family envelope stress response protein [Lachnospiraceae bacterium]
MKMDSLKIYEAENIGEVRVTEDVIAIIAGLAATEVEGVHSMAGGITNEIVAKLGRKNLAAGVNVSCVENVVQVTLSLVIEVGFNIPEVCRIVQERVKTAIENMTGLTVETVDIKIANVNIDN